MSRPVHVVTEVLVPPRLVAAVRTRVPLGRVAEHFGPHLDQVYALARIGGVMLDGQNIFIYREAHDGVLTVDFGVGARAPFVGVGNVQPTMTPNGTAAMTTHWGEYRLLRAAHDAVQEWCRVNQRSLDGASWEVYDHWRENPAELRTDIYYLLRSDLSLDAGP